VTIHLQRYCRHQDYSRRTSLSSPSTYKTFPIIRILPKRPTNKWLPVGEAGTSENIPLHRLALISLYYSLYCRGMIEYLPRHHKGCSGLNPNCHPPVGAWRFIKEILWDGCGQLTRLQFPLGWEEATVIFFLSIPDHDLRLYVTMYRWVWVRASHIVSTGM
jgi:hypothetical protein